MQTAQLTASSQVFANEDKIDFEREGGSVFFLLGNKERAATCLSLSRAYRAGVEHVADGTAVSPTYISTIKSNP